MVSRLSDVVRPGLDYPAKVKIAEVLDHEVLITGFDRAISTEVAPTVDPETGEVVYREYYNVTVDDQGVMKTFSTGAIPVMKVLDALAKRIEAGEVELPILATFRKEGRTYVVV